MKTNAAALLPLAVAIVLPLLPAAASAQSGSRAPVHPATTPIAFGNGGNFKSTDGTVGTYRQTETFYNLNASNTVTTVYTRGSDNATRTETVINLTNADGTHTRNTTLTDYGASASFTSTQAITTLGRGQSVGHGTYLAADGSGGTLTTVETTATGGVDVLTSVYDSPTAGVTTEQRTRTNATGPILERLLANVAGGNPVPLVFVSTDGTVDPNALSSVAFKTVFKTVTVDAAGNASNAVLTLSLDLETTGQPLTP